MIVRDAVRAFFPQAARLLATISVLGSCGAKTGLPLGGELDGSTAATDGGALPRPPSAFCVSATANAPCAPDNATCEFGADIDPHCNPTLRCIMGVWTALPETGCTARAPNESCPIVAPSRDVACGSTGLTFCDYPAENTLCSCAGGRMTCEANACVFSRPRLGATCNVEGEVLLCAGCGLVFGFSIQQACQFGHWALVTRSRCLG